MHYKDGTPARLFDVVKGRPYNTAYEVTGVVSSLNPSSQDGACGIYVHFASPGKAWGGNAPSFINLTGDYGGCGEFELVHRPHIAEPSVFAWATDADRDKFQPEPGLG